MTQFFDFTNKVVVITGAGGVICGELAKSFGKQGAKVALLDLNGEAAQKFADEIIAEGAPRLECSGTIWRYRKSI